METGDSVTYRIQAPISPVPQLDVLQEMKRYSMLVAISLVLSGCILPLPLPSMSDQSPQFQGRVLDGHSRKPIRNAQLFVQGDQKHRITTDSQGYFLLKPRRNFHVVLLTLPSQGVGYPRGFRSSVLVAEAPGYAPLTLDFTDPKISDVHTLKIDCEEGYLEFRREYRSLKPLYLKPND